MLLTGSCICHKIEYELELESADDARTSVCHCRNCKVPIHTTLNLIIALIQAESFRDELRPDSKGSKRCLSP
jgi:hypothetical protein